LEPSLLSTLQFDWPPLIEWWAFALAIIYVILAARNSEWCWPFAFVSSCLWAWQVWFAYDLLFDAALNVFYAVMAIWGAWRWWRQDDTNTNVQISTFSWSQHALIIGFGVSLTFVLGYVAAQISLAAMTYLDAFTTVFSVFATFMLIERKLENWLYLLVMDVLYVYLYLQRGSLVFAGLFVIYCILAIAGFVSWRKMQRAQKVGREYQNSGTN